VRDEGGDVDIDWERELDRAIAPGGERSPSDYVGPGRRALRRRRSLVSVASAAAVAVALGVGASVGGATGLVGGGATGAGFAVDGGPDAGRDPVGERPDWSMGVPDRCEPAVDDQPAGYDGRGNLCLADGASIVERVENPMDYPRGGSRSVGLVVEVDDTRDFVFATWEGRGSTSVFSRSAVGSLEDWLAGQVTARRMLDGTAEPGGPADWVSLGESGPPVAGPGVTVLDSREVDLGEAFAPPGAPAWAVELDVDGQRELALVRRIDGSTDVIPGTRAFDDLDAFVADAREQYASGAGLL